jgi:hypothetical protein
MRVEVKLSFVLLLARLGAMVSADPISVAFAGYESDDCTGTGSVRWARNGTCWAYNDGPGSTGSLQYVCADSGDIVVSSFESSDCSGEPMPHINTPPGICLNETRNSRSSSLFNNERSGFWECVPSSTVPAVQPRAGATVSVTGFTQPDCMWDTVFVQNTVVLGECSPFLQTQDSGMYHPIGVIVTECQDGAGGMASFTLYPTTDCIPGTEAGNSTQATACTATGQSGSMLIQCKLSNQDNNEEKMDSLEESD